MSHRQQRKKGVVLRCAAIKHDVVIYGNPFSFERREREGASSDVTNVETVYGVIDFEINSYVVVVTRATPVASITGKNIYRAVNFQLHCLAESEDQRDQVYVKGIKQILNSPYWYFSHNYFLNNSLQDQLKGVGLRPEYMFNAYWAGNTQHVKKQDSLLREGVVGCFIHGLVQSQSIIFGSFIARLTLISRICSKRYGGKWVLRGIEENGYASNTVQTEMILTLDAPNKRDTYSYVQLRGTIPYLWKQTPDLGLNPPIQIYHDDKVNCQLLKKNYATISKNYDQCTLINTLDWKKSEEDKLGKAFYNLHDMTGSSFELKWIDFKKQTDRYIKKDPEALSFVLKDLERYGYYWKSNQLQRKTQRGVYRTNCLNSLDRTNILQTFIAKIIVQKWIQQATDKAQASTKIMEGLKQVMTDQWTENAHTIAKINSGSLALRTDKNSSKGKKTMGDALKDGKSKAKRRYYGHLIEPVTQNYKDLLVGKLNPQINSKHRISEPLMSPVYLYFMLIILGCLFFSFGIAPAVLGRSSGMGGNILRVLIGLVVTAFTLHKFPRVVITRHVLFEDWESPGFRSLSERLHPKKD